MSEMSMVQKVRWAIYRALEDRKDPEGVARAAIEAMREPTELMKQRGQERVWKVMIATALLSL